MNLVINKIFEAHNSLTNTKFHIIIPKAQQFLYRSKIETYRKSSGVGARGDDRRFHALRTDWLDKAFPEER